MKEFQQAADFISLSEECTSVEGLRRALAHVLEQFGVSHYSLVSVPREPGEAKTFRRLLQNTPESWRQHYTENRYWNFDAATHFAFQTDQAFSWSEVERARIPASSRRLFSEIRDAMHVGGGLVVPVHNEDGFGGVVGLFHEDKELSPRVRSALKLIAIYAIERVTELSDPVGPPLPCPFTVRQREILAYSAVGKSESDIADILSISAATVREHILNIRASLGVRTKVQAVAVAIARGWLTI